MTTLHLRKAISRSPLRLAFLLIPLALALACFALAPAARAVDPAPDGGYPGFNTAEGENALFSLDTSLGVGNTADGAYALYENTTGSYNTAIGFDALTAASGSDNTAIGVGALELNAYGNNNTAIGVFSLQYNGTGVANTATGWAALVANTFGNNNTATGYLALGNNKSGADNTANGYGALENNQKGNRNIALGFEAGVNLTKGDNNIYIGNHGKKRESNTIHLGMEGTQTATFIAGISGSTVADGVTVIVDTNGHLGTMTSSARFKEAVKPMDKASEAILALQPVTFRYKHELDPEGIPQFGLVAEEVEKVNPDLVARDADGKAYTVRYEAVNAMLLNEFLKEHRKNEEQQAMIARLEKQVEALTAGLQKVSAQLELSKFATGRICLGGPEPRTVLNNH